MDFVIFQYVVANIILYSKSSSSATTVKIRPRTSSQCRTPAGISSCPYPCLRLKKPGVVFAEPYFINRVTNFDKFFFEKNGKRWTIELPSFIKISATLAELFKKQSVAGLYSHPVPLSLYINRSITKKFPIKTISERTDSSIKSPGEVEYDD